MNLAIFALTKNGIQLARNFSQRIDVDLFTNPKNFKKHVRYAFKKYDGLIFIMATGIVVRTIAPLLKNKAEDPAVVVLDEKGKYVISLLSGHLGGANNLAKDIAKIIGAKPVITTATDVNNLPCIEDIAERFNLAIEDFKKIKIVNSAIVNGRPVAFVVDDAKRLKAIKKEAGSREWGAGFKFYKSIFQIKHNKTDVFVIIANNILPHTPHPTSRILLRPKDLAVGIGCDRGVALKEVESAYFSVLKKWDVSPLSVRNLASIDVKKNETGLLKFAGKYNLPISFYSKDELADMPLPSGFSKFVMGKVGVGGVCEPAALKSAGTRKIWIKKQKLGRVTIAAAKVPFTVAKNSDI
ncbi:MAG: cobalt-precorrin 5A hydrolase [Deltaproteobacteria bacterium]|nr:cobalt-precorrin 5A hydrolase [Deltaproteobacteria bacterium]